MEWAHLTSVIRIADIELCVGTSAVIRSSRRSGRECLANRSYQVKHTSPATFPVQDITLISDCQSQFVRVLERQSGCNGEIEDQASS